MTHPSHLVLFDGQCAVCNRAVQFLLDHDAERRLHFAPLQGTTAADLLQRHPELEELDTLVYVNQLGAADEKIQVHSAAVFAISRLLPAPWRWVAAASVLPRAASDAAYRKFAASRYSLFGTADTCRIPQPEDAARFHA